MASEKGPKVTAEYEEAGVSFRTIEDTLVHKGKEMVFSFSIAKDVENLAKLFTKGGEPAEVAYRRYYAGSDLAGRGKARPREATENTIIRRGGREIDLMKLDPATIAPLYNSELDKVKALGGDLPGAFVAWATKMVAAGKVTKLATGKVKAA